MQAGRARASPSTDITSAGRSGTCGSASPPGKGSSCTGSATTTAAASGPSSTARRCRRCSCPTPIPRATHYRKLVLDEGEYGIGLLTNILELGCDCLGEIRYLDGVVNDNDGKAMVIPNAICLHEEDSGIAWKHTDFRTGYSEVRRMRRMVISSIVTVGNYEYAYYWYLYQDGSLEYQVKLTGVISTGAVPPGTVPGHGTLVAPGVYGPHHQHFFNVRLDMAVDGPANRVYEVNPVALPEGPGQPGRERVAGRGGPDHLRGGGRPQRRSPRGPVLEGRQRSGA